MSTTYIAQLALPDTNDTTIVNNVRVGNEVVRFRFQWAIVSEEQYNIIQ